MKLNLFTSFFIVVLMSPSLGMGGDEKIEAYKERIQKNHSSISKSPDQRSEHLLKKALCYVKDQELEKGLQTFLLSLNELLASKKEPYVTLKYQEALGNYLQENDSGFEPRKIVEEYEKDYQIDKRDSGLGFILAAAYAQLGNYSRFMEIFYECYYESPDHYLADRILGMVHLKLVKFAQTIELKKEHEKTAYDYFNKALHQNPKDALLFRLTLLLSPKEERGELVKENLKLILEEDTMLTRMDIYAYVRESLSYGYVDLTKQLLQKARVCYPESRTLDAAEKYFEQFQSKQGG